MPSSSVADIEARFQPIRSCSVSDAVYEQLRNLILSGELVPGQVLPPERQLSELLGANRQAVREALKRLAQHQLVSIQQGGRTKVLDFLASESLDLLHQLLIPQTGEIDLLVVRSVVELRVATTPDMARLAALRSGPACAPELSSALDQMKSWVEHPDPGELQSAVEAFWAGVARASRNVAYQLVNNTMRRIHQSVAEHLPGLLGREFANVTRYREISAAVTEAKVQRAEDIAREHCRELALDLRAHLPL